MNEVELVGARYRAVRRLSNKDDVTLANVGETCDRVPASSLPGLLASGKIEPVSTPVSERVWNNLGRPTDGDA